MTLWFTLLEWQFKSAVIWWQTGLEGEVTYHLVITNNVIIYRPNKHMLGACHQTQDTLCVTLLKSTDIPDTSNGSILQRRRPTPRVQIHTWCMWRQDPNPGSQA